MKDAQNAQVLMNVVHVIQFLSNNREIVLTNALKIHF